MKVILRLTSEQLRMLKDESRKTYPAEACALLFGKLMDEEAVVTKVVVVSNVLRSPVKFEADPQTVFNVFEKADQEGLEFIGLFHSHPAPARPSMVDIKYMRLWGEAIWLILSSNDGNIAAFQKTNINLHEVTLKVEA
ncbi:MAG: M67 family metallopeptidase [Candidatus Bathyarchaeota archaeon]|nr:MAG: M67 family metallopeptidase [Candidatus Bathyarchaeota archaeon]